MVDLLSSAFVGDCLMPAFVLRWTSSSSFAAAVYSYPQCGDTE
jgi:hypothetical protein